MVISVSNLIPYDCIIHYISKFLLPSTNHCMKDSKLHPILILDKEILLNLQPYLPLCCPAKYFMCTTNKQKINKQRNCNILDCYNQHQVCSGHNPIDYQIWKMFIKTEINNHDRMSYDSQIYNTISIHPEKKEIDWGDDDLPFTAHTETLLEYWNSFEQYPNGLFALVHYIRDLVSHIDTGYKFMHFCCGNKGLMFRPI